MIDSNVIEDFKRIGLMHSGKLPDALATCQCIYSLPSQINTADSTNEALLRMITAQVCEEPLKRRGPLDAHSLALIELWLSDYVTVAICDVGWPDGISFRFATVLKRLPFDTFIFEFSTPYVQNRT
jgi:hypothetical protein